MSKLPVVPVDEEAAVTTIAGWIDRVAERLTSESARQVLRNHIRDRLLRQEAIPRMQVIAAAEAGNRDADLVLREFAIEYLSRGEAMPTEIANYVQRALLKPPVADSPGRNIADTFQRDILICVLVDLAALQWELRATRNPASKKASAAYLVAIALKRRGIPLGEARVNKIHHSFDAIVRNLSASIPPI